MGLESILYEIKILERNSGNTVNTLFRYILFFFVKGLCVLLEQFLS